MTTTIQHYAHRTTDSELHTQALYHLAKQYANSEERYRNLLETVKEIIFECQSDGLLTFLNAAWEQTLSFKKEYSIYDYIQSFVHKEDIYLIQKLLRKVNTNQTATAKVIRFVDAFGAEYSFEIRLTSTDSGTIVGTLYNITESRAKYAQLKASNQQLKSINKKLQNFAHVVAHDLKAPLRAMSTMATWLEEDFGDTLQPLAQEYIESIKKGAKEMEMLINGVLKYSKVSCQTVEFKSVNTQKVLEKLLLTWEPMRKKENVQLIIKNLPTIIGHELQLRQLFQNLIDNAIKYRATDRLCEITIDAKQIGKEWLFKIQDNGMGFDQSDAKQIFQPFIRLKTNQKGTGVGLAICHHIVQQHKGKIWAESKPGQGTSVFFTLPILEKQ